MKSGSRRVFRYSSTHEKEIPDGSFRRRMELHSAPSPCPQRAWTAEVPRPSRDPKRRLLRPKERLPMALAPPRLPSMAHRLLVLQKMAYRWHLGEHQPGHPRTPARAPEKGPSAQRGRGGQPVGQEHRGRRRTARLRWWQEGEGPQAPHLGGYRGLRAQGEGPQRQGDGLRGDQDAAAAGERAIPSPTASVVGRGLPRRGQGRRLGTEDAGLERGAGGASEEARPRKGDDGVGQG